MYMFLCFMYVDVILHTLFYFYVMLYIMFYFIRLLAGCRQNPLEKGTQKFKKNFFLLYFILLSIILLYYERSITVRKFIIMWVVQVAALNREMTPLSF